MKRVDALRYKECPKCEGNCWLWWNELERYEGPATETGQDDTKCTCDACGGTGRVIVEDTPSTPPELLGNADMEEGY